MNIIPCMRCKNMAESVAFYTQVLDFELVGTWPETGDPAFSRLKRVGAELTLSSHSGDGVFGNKAYVVVPNVDALFQQFIQRGLDTSAKKESPVHRGPTDQTWGTREFYVDDPSGNSLIFGQR
jgi:catechol 2,3-dioxygenase-like lactoylglutathione lyase family enzyme